MEQLYYWIGLIVFWLCTCVGALLLYVVVLFKVLTFLFKSYGHMKTLYQFVRKRKQFEEWLNRDENNTK